MMLERITRKLWFKLVAAVLCVVIPATEIGPAYADIGSSLVGAGLVPARNEYGPDEIGGRPQGAPLHPMDPAIAPGQISIPSEIGSVQEIFSGRGNSTIIHIQDAHGSISAQENIAKLVKYLHENYGIKLLTVEGAAGEVDLKGVRDFPDASVRGKIAERYLRSFDLTGDEYYLISENPAMTMFGAERMLKYYFNRDQFFRAKALSEKLKPVLGKFNIAMKSLEREVCGPALRKFLEETERAKAHHEFLLRHIKNIGQTLGDAFGKYPHLQAAAQNNASEIDPAAFLAELESAEHSVTQMLAATDREKNLIVFSRSVEFLQKLIGLSLSSENYGELENLSFPRKRESKALDPRFRGDDMLEYFRTEFGKFATGMRWPENFNALFNSLKIFLDFYAGAKKRDAVFVKNTSNALQKKKVSNAILITGGFHTAGLTELWRKENISFVVIRPNMNEPNPREMEIYQSKSLSRILETSKIVLAERGFGISVPWRMGLRERMISDMHLEMNRLKSAAGFGVGRVEPEEAIRRLNEMIRRDTFPGFPKFLKDFSSEDIKTVKQWLTVRDAALLPPDTILRKLWSHILAQRFYAYERKGRAPEQREITEVWVRLLAARWGITEAQVDALLVWFVRSGIKPWDAEISESLLSRFLKTYLEDYAIGRPLRARKGALHKMLPSVLSSKEKLEVVIENIERAGREFSPDFVKGKKIFKVPLRESPYFLAMYFGSVEDPFRMVLALTDKDVPRRPLAGKFFQITVDIAGENISVVTMKGVKGKEELINKTFLQDVGMRPGLALYYPVIVLSELIGFERLVGLRGEHHTTAEHGKPLNYSAIYHALGLRRKSATGRWNEISSLLGRYHRQWLDEGIDVEAIHRVQNSSVDLFMHVMAEQGGNIDITDLAISVKEFAIFDSGELGVEEVDELDSAHAVRLTEYTVANHSAANYTMDLKSVNNVPAILKEPYVQTGINELIGDAWYGSGRQPVRVTIDRLWSKNTQTAGDTSVLKIVIKQSSSTKHYWEKLKQNGWIAHREGLPYLLDLTRRQRDKTLMARGEGLTFFADLVTKHKIPVLLRFVRNTAQLTIQTELYIKVNTGFGAEGDKSEDAERREWQQKIRELRVKMASTLRQGRALLDEIKTEESVALWWFDETRNDFENQFGDVWRSTKSLHNQAEQLGIEESESEELFRPLRALSDKIEAKLWAHETPKPYFSGIRPLRRSVHPEHINETFYSLKDRLTFKALWNDSIFLSGTIGWFALFFMSFYLKKGTPFWFPYAIAFVSGLILFRVYRFIRGQFWPQAHYVIDIRAQKDGQYFDLDPAIALRKIAFSAPQPQDILVTVRDAKDYQALKDYLEDRLGTSERYDRLYLAKMKYSQRIGYELSRLWTLPYAGKIFLGTVYLGMGLLVLAVNFVTSLPYEDFMKYAFLEDAFSAFGQRFNQILALLHNGSFGFRGVWPPDLAKKLYMYSVVAVESLNPFTLFWLTVAVAAFRGLIYRRGTIPHPETKIFQSSVRVKRLGRKTWFTAAALSAALFFSSEFWLAPLGRQFIFNTSRLVLKIPYLRSNSQFTEEFLTYIHDQYGQPETLKGGLDQDVRDIYNEYGAEWIPGMEGYHHTGSDAFFNALDFENLFENNSGKRLELFTILSAKASDAAESAVRLVSSYTHEKWIEKSEQTGQFKIYSLRAILGFLPKLEFALDSIERNWDTWGKSFFDSKGRPLIQKTLQKILNPSPEDLIFSRDQFHGFPDEIKQKAEAIQRKLGALQEKSASSPVGFGVGLGTLFSEVDAVLDLPALKKRLVDKNMAGVPIYGQALSWDTFEKYAWKKFPSADLEEILTFHLAVMPFPFLLKAWRFVIEHRDELSPNLYSRIVAAVMINDIYEIEPYMHIETMYRNKEEFLKVVKDEWGKFPDMEKKENLEALLASGNSSVATWAWYYVQEHKDQLGPLFHEIATFAKLKNALSSPHENIAGQSFKFFNTHRELFSGTEQAELLSAAFEGVHEDYAWYFVMKEWGNLPDLVRKAITAKRLKTALVKLDSTTSIFAWLFLRKHWLTLSPELKEAVGQDEFNKALFEKTAVKHVSLWDPETILQEFTVLSVATEFFSAQWSAFSPQMGLGLTWDPVRILFGGNETLAKSAAIGLGDTLLGDRTLPLSILKAVALYHSEWITQPPSRDIVERFRNERMKPNFKYLDTPKDAADPEEMTASTVGYVLEEGNAAIPGSDLVVEDIRDGTRVAVYNLELYPGIQQLADPEMFTKALENPALGRPSAAYLFHSQGSKEDQDKRNRLLAAHLLDVIFRGDVTDLVFEVRPWKTPSSKNPRGKEILERIEKFKKGDLKAADFSDLLLPVEHWMEYDSAFLQMDGVILGVLKAIFEMAQEEGGLDVLRHVRFHFPEVDDKKFGTGGGIAEISPGLYNVTKEILSNGERKAIVFSMSALGFKHGTAYEDKKHNGDSLVMAVRETNADWARKIRIYAVTGQKFSALTGSKDPLMSAARRLIPPLPAQTGFVIGVRVNSDAPFLNQRVSTWINGPLNTYRDTHGVIVVRIKDDGEDDEREDIPFHPRFPRSSQPSPAAFEPEIYSTEEASAKSVLASAGFGAAVSDNPFHLSNLPTELKTIEPDQIPRYLNMFQMARDEAALAEMRKTGLLSERTEAVLRDPSTMPVDLNEITEVLAEAAAYYDGIYRSEYPDLMPKGALIAARKLDLDSDFEQRRFHDFYRDVYRHTDPSGSIDNLLDWAAWKRAGLSPTEGVGKLLAEIYPSETQAYVRGVGKGAYLWSGRERENLEEVKTFLKKFVRKAAESPDVYEALLRVLGAFTEIGLEDHWYQGSFDIYGHGFFGYEKFGWLIHFLKTEGPHKDRYGKQIEEIDKKNRRMNAPFYGTYSDFSMKELLKLGIGETKFDAEKFVANWLFSHPGHVQDFSDPWYIEQIYEMLSAARSQFMAFKEADAIWSAFVTRLKWNPAAAKDFDWIAMGRKAAAGIAAGFVVSAVAFVLLRFGFHHNLLIQLVLFFSLTFLFLSTPPFLLALKIKDALVFIRASEKSARDKEGFQIRDYVWGEHDLIPLLKEFKQYPEYFDILPENVRPLLSFYEGQFYAYHRLLSFLTPLEQALLFTKSGALLDYLNTAKSKWNFFTNLASRWFGILSPLTRPMKKRETGRQQISDFNRAVSQIEIEMLKGISGDENGFKTANSQVMNLVRAHIGEGRRFVVQHETKNLDRLGEEFTALPENRAFREGAGFLLNGMDNVRAHFPFRFGKTAPEALARIGFKDILVHLYIFLKRYQKDPSFTREQAQELVKDIFKHYQVHPGIAAPPAKPFKRSLQDRALRTITDRNKALLTNVLTAFLKSKGNASIEATNFLTSGEILEEETKGDSKEFVALASLISLTAMGYPVPRVASEGEVLKQGEDVVNIAVHGHHRDDDWALLEEGARHEKANFIHPTKRGDIKFSKMNGKTIATLSEGIVFKDNIPYFVQFRKPLVLHYITDPDLGKNGLEKKARKAGIPLPGHSKIEKYTDDKFWAVRIFNEEDIATPETFKFSPPGGNETQIRNSLIHFLDQHQINEAVLKPNGGRGGNGVFFFSRGTIDDAVKVIHAYIQTKSSVLIQERIMPPLVEDRLDWNLRVFVNRDGDGKPFVSGMVVRADESGKAVNISQTAQVMTFDELAGRLKLSEVEKIDLKSKIESISVRALEAIETDIQEMFESVPFKGVQISGEPPDQLFTDLMGADVIVQKENNERVPYIMEINDFHSGGMWDLDNRLRELQANATFREPWTRINPDEIGSGSRGWVNTMIRRAKEYKETLSGFGVADISDEKFRTTYESLRNGTELPSANELAQILNLPAPVVRRTGRRLGLLFSDQPHVSSSPLARYANGYTDDIPHPVAVRLQHTRTGAPGFVVSTVYVSDLPDSVGKPGDEAKVSFKRAGENTRDLIVSVWPKSADIREEEPHMERRIIVTDEGGFKVERKQAAKKVPSAEPPKMKSERVKKIPEKKAPVVQTTPAHKMGKPLRPVLAELRRARLERKYPGTISVWEALDAWKDFTRTFSGKASDQEKIDIVNVHYMKYLSAMEKFIREEYRTVEVLREIQKQFLEVYYESGQLLSKKGKVILDRTVLEGEGVQALIAAHDRLLKYLVSLNDEGIFTGHLINAGKISGKLADLLKAYPQNNGADILILRNLQQYLLAAVSTTGEYLGQSTTDRLIRVPLAPVYQAYDTVFRETVPGRKLEQPSESNRGPDTLAIFEKYFDELRRNEEVKKKFSKSPVKALEQTRDEIISFVTARTGSLDEFLERTAKFCLALEIFRESNSFSVGKAVDARTEFLLDVLPFARSFFASYAEFDRFETGDANQDGLLMRMEDIIDGYLSPPEELREDQAPSGFGAEAKQSSDVSASETGRSSTSRIQWLLLALHQLLRPFQPSSLSLHDNQPSITIMPITVQIVIRTFISNWAKKLAAKRLANITLAKSINVFEMRVLLPWLSRFMEIFPFWNFILYWRGIERLAENVQIVNKNMIFSNSLQSGFGAAEDLTREEIDARMKKDGFPELAMLWNKFKKLKIDLNKIDGEKLDRSRNRHMGALTDHPIWLMSASAVVGIAFYLFQQDLISSLIVLKHPIQYMLIGLNAFLSLYAFLFFAVVFQRNLTHPWKKISAIDLASMLKRRNYGLWFGQTAKAQKTVSWLRALGINENWDNPDYRVRYRNVEGNIEAVETEKAHEFIQKTLREVLGFKEDRVFRPGKFNDSLIDGKNSISGFIRLYQEKIDKNKAGELPLEEGVGLLRNLLTYLKPESAGWIYVNKAVQTAERGIFTPGGTVEAKIWDRNPWVDLTREKDFYSSAALRGRGFADIFQRRTKGLLAPFGYLRNKSISAMDFTTEEGRTIRARIAAAVYKDATGNDQAILFVDGLEGRIYGKQTAMMKLIKQAIEDYAKASGFNSIFYFRHPLNKTPERFTRYVESTGAPTEELYIEYADSSEREYLDAFGLPFEPFEYAFPKGKVMGYFVQLGTEINRNVITPSKTKLFISKAKKKYLLSTLVGLVLPSMGWMMWEIQPSLILPAGILLGSILLYDSIFHRRALRQKSSRDSEKPNLPRFIKSIKSEVEKNPIAKKMDYAGRLDKKIEKLLQYFPSPDSSLRYFFEEVLFNTSVKDSDLTNVLKFLDKLKDDEKKAAAQLFTVIWPERNPNAEKNGLSEDKDAREQLKKELFEKIDAVRKFVKATKLSRREISQIVSMQKALKLDILDVLKIITISPRVLRGLNKPPRPYFAWIIPTAVAIPTAYTAAFFSPALSLWVLYGILMGIIIPGTYWISMRLNIAPGVLRYKKIRNYLSQIIAGKREKTAIEFEMEQIGINIGEYEKEKVYENQEKGTRIVIRNKKTLEGAVKFLTSSEEIDCCIALQNFVSWALPSMLNDESIMLADVYYKGTGSAYSHRAQIWMVAAEEAGVPVLTVNSFEFNEEGSKYIDVLMPEAVNVLRDVAQRAGFKKIYAGITDFGRNYLDKHFKQGETKNKIRKIHHPEAGYKYAFDVYARAGRDFVYQKKRGIKKRAYALTFGMIEWAKGNKAKAQAFFDSTKNINNFWEIPLEQIAESQPSAGFGAEASEISENALDRPLDRLLGIKIPEEIFTKALRQAQVNLAQSESNGWFPETESLISEMIGVTGNDTVGSKADNYSITMNDLINLIIFISFEKEAGFVKHRDEQFQIDAVFEAVKSALLSILARETGRPRMQWHVNATELDMLESFTQDTFERKQKARFFEMFEEQNIISTDPFSPEEIDIFLLFDQQQRKRITQRLRDFIAETKGNLKTEPAAHALQKLQQLEEADGMFPAAGFGAAQEHSEQEKQIAIQGLMDKLTRFGRPRARVKNESRILGQPEEMLNDTPKQSSLLAGKKALELDEGLIYHWSIDLDPILEAGGLLPNTAWTRTPQRWGTPTFKIEPKHLAVFVLNTSKFNELLRAQKATLSFGGSYGRRSQPFMRTNVILPFSDIREIWLDEDTYANLGDKLSSKIGKGKAHIVRGLSLEKIRERVHQFESEKLPAGITLKSIIEVFLRKDHDRIAQMPYFRDFAMFHAELRQMLTGPILDLILERNLLKEVPAFRRAGNQTGFGAGEKIKPSARDDFSSQIPKRKEKLEEFGSIFIPAIPGRDEAIEKWRTIEPRLAALLNEIEIPFPSEISELALNIMMHGGGGELKIEADWLYGGTKGLLRATGIAILPIQGNPNDAISQRSNEEIFRRIANLEWIEGNGLRNFILPRGPHRVSIEKNGRYWQKVHNDPLNRPFKYIKISNVVAGMQTTLEWDLIRSGNRLVLQTPATGFGAANFKMTADLLRETAGQIKSDPKVNHSSRTAKLKKIIDRLKKNGEVYLGVSKGGSVHGPLNKFREWIEPLSSEGKVALIGFILFLRDERKISFSQAYALVHMIFYAGAPLDNHKEIAKALGLNSDTEVSRMLHRRIRYIKERKGVLSLIDDQPELKSFPVKLKEDGEEPIVSELNIRQRIAVAAAVLGGKTYEQIGRELPSIAGDLRIQPVSAATVGSFLSGYDSHTQELAGALPVLTDELKREGIEIGSTDAETNLLHMSELMEALGKLETPIADQAFLQKEGLVVTHYNKDVDWVDFSSQRYLNGPVKEMFPRLEQKINERNSGFGIANAAKQYRTLFVSGAQYRNWIEESVTKEEFPFRASPDLRIIVIDSQAGVAEKTAAILRDYLKIKPDQIRSGSDIDRISTDWLLNGEIYAFADKRDIPARFHVNVIENNQAWVDFLIYLAVSKLVAKAA